jgi:hypothetical protein
MTSAAITPGTQPQNVKSRTIRKEPQPLPITAKGGKSMANNTRMKLILILIDALYRSKNSVTCYSKRQF